MGLYKLLPRRRDATGPMAIWMMWLGAVGDTFANAARVHLDILRQDLRHTSRTLRRTPGFTVTAVLVTALGVGATTAAFTLADHVLLRPLPFPEPDQLVKIWEGRTVRPASLRGLPGTNDVAPPNYLDWKSMSSSFSVMGAYTFVSSNLVGGGEPVRLDGANVSADAMNTIGVSPALGRLFTAADDATGAPCTVLLGDGLWHQRVGGESSILGRAIVLDDESCTVIGVMPRAFEFPTRSVRFWRAIRFRADAWCVSC